MHEPEGIRANAGGKSIDSIDSLLQPEHDVTANGEHDNPQSGNKPDLDLAPHSNESGYVPVSRGQHDREAAVDGGGTGVGCTWVQVSGIVDSAKEGKVLAGKELSELTHSHPLL